MYPQAKQCFEEVLEKTPFEIEELHHFDLLLFFFFNTEQSFWQR